jgi:hypothetical protein
MCPNCGIKVSSTEESGCPGCGHIQSDYPANPESENSYSNTKIPSTSLKKNPLNLVDDEMSWIRDFLGTHVDERRSDFETNPRETMLEVEAHCLEGLSLAPNEKSKQILSSYLSFLYIQMGRHKQALEFGKVGVECEDDFFKYQALNSIFYSLFEFNLNDEFKVWLDKARKIDFPDLAYHEINYYVNIGSLEDALRSCDKYSALYPEWGNDARARIYRDFNRFDEAEALYRKVTSRKATTPFYANTANSLAFSVLMPQKRFVEAEEVLLQALCSTDVREKINAYSNLAMVAFHLKEYDAAKRYANVGANSHDMAIASESRLTLIQIENQRLSEDENVPAELWDDLVNQIQEDLRNTHFDDADDLFQLLISACQRSSFNKDLVDVVQKQYENLKDNIEWNYNPKITANIEIARIDFLSERYLREEKYDKLHELFASGIEYLQNHYSETLLAYLETGKASQELRRKCLSISDKRFLANWAKFEKDPEINLELSSNKFEPILLALAQNPAVTDRVLKIIADENDLDLDFAISTRDALSQEMVAVLISSNFETVRREIASRPDLEYSDYERLATDEALLVRDAIRENPACSAELKALAALGSL